MNDLLPASYVSYASFRVTITRIERLLILSFFWKQVSMTWTTSQSSSWRTDQSNTGRRV